MRLESDFEGLLFFIALVVVLVLGGLGMKAFYGFGYYEGRAGVLEKCQSPVKAAP